MNSSNIETPAFPGYINLTEPKPSADETVTQQMVDQRQMAMVEDMLKKGMDISTIKSITGASDDKTAGA